jgi:DNA-binding transcriptional ArsR family regulator
VTTATSDLLALLGDATRRGVVETLARREASAGDLALDLGTTPAALTRHLRLLRNAGVVSVSLDPDDNRRHVYRMQPEPFGELRDWADGIATFWTRPLSAFSDHAAGATRGQSKARR